MENSRLIRYRSVLLHGKVSVVRSRLPTALLTISPSERIVEDFYLPRMIEKIHGQTRTRIGDAVISTRNTCLGEMFLFPSKRIKIQECPFDWEQHSTLNCSRQQCADCGILTSRYRNLWRALDSEQVRLSGCLRYWTGANLVALELAMDWMVWRYWVILLAPMVNDSRSLNFGLNQ